MHGEQPHLVIHRVFCLARLLPRDVRAAARHRAHVAVKEAVFPFARFPGVDLILIGTNDMLADMGLPGQYDHPKVEDAYKRTISCCRKHGKHVGVGGFGSRPDLVEK